MEAISFAYWLQGFVELHGQPPTAAQWEVVKEHLGLVFNKVTVKTVNTPHVSFGGELLCAAEKAQGLYCGQAPEGYKLFELNTGDSSQKLKIRNKLQPISNEELMSYTNAAISC